MKVNFPVRLALSAVFLCLTSVQNTTAQPFEPLTASILPSLSPAEASWADFDGDGDMDLLTFDSVAPNTTEPRLYRFDGTNSFVRAPFPPAANSYDGKSHFWGDSSGDGRLDLLLSGSNFWGPLMRIFEGKADGTFVDTQVSLAGEPKLWADLDNDGRLDVVATTSFGLPFPWIWWNQGGTNYVKTTPLELSIPGYSGTSIRSVAAADFDGDGDLDLLIAYGGGVPMRLLRNDGKRVFTDTGTKFPEGEGVSPTWLDADGDGDLDLAGAGPESSTVLYRNEGNIRFSKMDSGLPSSYGAATWGDLDLDGDPDVLIGAVRYEPFKATEIRIYSNIGSGYFEDSRTVLPALTANAVQVADFDGDLDLDFMLSEGPIWNSDPALRRFFRNNHPPAMAIPIAPTGLTAEPVGNRVLLRWTGSGRFMTFSVRVGTQPGAADIMSPLSGSSGRRMVPSMGNTQTSTNWYLVGLKPGTYYWSVQSVDAAFRGSPFAAESSFIVPEVPVPLPPPSISALPHLFMEEDGAALSVDFVIGPATSLPNLSVNADSDNLALIPLSAITITGTGTNRTFTVKPTTNQFGTSSITVTVADAANQSVRSTFLLTVDPVNDVPSLEPIPDQVTYANSPSLIVPFKASDPDSTTTLTASSSNPELVAPNGIEIIQTSATNSALRLTALPNKIGSTIITLVADDGMHSGSVQFVVAVLPQPFVAVDGFSVSSGSGDVQVADFDGDGRLDLFLLDPFAGPPTQGMKLLRNEGGGRFAGSGTLPFERSGGTAVVVDYDTDGDLDILLAGLGQARVLRNNGGNNFTADYYASDLLPYLNAGAVGSWGDVDNDGKPDWVYSLTGLAQMGILKNSGGKFSPIGILPKVSGNVALGDYDSDGVLDIAFSGTTGSGVVTNGLLHGMGAGVYMPASLGLDQTAQGPVGWGDIDGDGRLDLWHLQAITSDRRLLIYRGLSGQGFAAPVVVPLAVVNYKEFHWADFDGDGDLDFATEVYLNSIQPRIDTSKGAGLTIFRNDGGLRFTPIGHVAPISEVRYMSVGDFDGDGAIDLTALQNGFNVGALLNKMSAPNPPPGAPQGLKAEVSGNSAHLTWRRSTDFNQANGLTYNVRVGTRPNSGDVLQALSLTNGSRLVADFGNAGVRTNSFLTNLVGETFYWSVQAVDNSFIGGPFAQEKSFVVDLPGNEPPMIGEISDRTISEDTQTTVAFSVIDDRTPPDRLRLRAFAGDPFLLPSNQLILGGTGTNRTLSIRPGQDRTGTTVVTVEATDAVGAKTVRAFAVAVSGVNDAPSISTIPDQLHLYSAEPYTVAFSISDPDTSADSLVLRAESSDPSLVLSNKFVFGGSGTNRTLTIGSIGPVEGTTTITVFVEDEDGASASTSFALSLRNEVLRMTQTEFGGTRNGSIAWGDLDNDGDLDLALSGQGIPQTLLYRNDGQGIFSKLDTDIPAVDGGGVDWGDYDNDGRIDLLVHGRNQSSGPWAIARIYRNLGSGRFQLVEAGLTGRYGAAAWGDYDNDGRLDIVSTGQDLNGSDRTIVYHNEGNARFVALPGSLDGVGSVNLIWPGRMNLWRDVDGDGNLDLILQRSAPFGARDVIYHGDGKGGFTEVPTPWSGSFFGWADFDNDGRPDLLESTGRRQNLRVLRNLGNGVFAPWGINIQTNFTPDSVAIGDYNNDGHLDLLTSGYEGDFSYITRLFSGRSDGAWKAASSPLLDFIFGSASWADVDGNGALDLVMNGQRDQAPMQGYSTTLFLNSQTPSNRPPNAPQGLKAFFTSNSVVLTWLPATDPNQSGGLTYNVRVGTTPGGVDVVSPMSEPNGMRLVAKPGNAGWRTRKLLSGNRRGETLYWSVQAVDNSDAGSSFATEGVLAIGEPPSLAELTDQQMDEDQTLSIPLVLADLDGDVSALIVTASSSDSELFPAGGMVVVGNGANRTLVLSPSPDRNGMSTIDVTAVDPQGGTVSHSFVMIVKPVNDPPVAHDQSFTLEEDSSLSFEIVATDPDGDALSYELVSGPRHGRLVGTIPRLTYEPVTNFFGNDALIFRVIDGNGGTATGRISFVVTPVPEGSGPQMSVRFLSDRTPVLKLQGEPFQDYVVETSEDLSTWSPLETLYSEDGVIEFIGEIPRPGSGRFYRARSK